VPAVVALLSAVSAALIVCAALALVVPPIRRDALEILDVARRMLRPARSRHAQRGPSASTAASSTDQKDPL
jgi:heme exporter protein D